MRRIMLRAAHSEAILADGAEDATVFKLEGNWYFNPEVVDMSHLQVTDRTYVCPHKGTCFWIDLAMPDHHIANVAWVYTIIKPGYERIKDKIAFYPGRREGTVEI